MIFRRPGRPAEKELLAREASGKNPNFSNQKIPKFSTVTTTTTTGGLYLLFVNIIYDRCTLPREARKGNNTRHQGEIDSLSFLMNL